MRRSPLCLLALATAGPGCLPPPLSLGSSDGSAGSGGAPADVSQPIDGMGTGAAGGSAPTGGAAGGGGGRADASGADGSDAAGGKGDTAGSGGNAGNGGNAGSGGSAGNAGSAGRGGGAGNSGNTGDAARTPDALDADSGSGGGKPDASDAPPTPPSCRDRFPNAIFCDNFEDSLLPSWTVFPPREGGMDGETRHTTGVVYRGTGALSSRKDGIGDGTPVYADVLGGRTSGHVFVRTYLYVQSPLPGEIPVGSAASILVLGESGGDLGGISFVLWKDAVSLTIRGVWQDQVKKDPYPMPYDQWVCLQFDFAIGTAAVPRIRINGQDIGAVVCPVNDAGTCNTLMPTSYERLWLGINWTGYDPPTSATVLYDDIVVSTEDVACD